jgi:hypothetical protein
MSQATFWLGLDRRLRLDRAEARCRMSQATFWLVAFLVLVVASIGGMFLYGWLRRKDEPPKVKPLPPDDED